MRTRADGATLRAGLALWRAVCGRPRKRTLLCDVEAPRAIGIVVSAAEEFAEYGVVSASATLLAIWRAREGQEAGKQGEETYGFFTPFGLICQPAR